MSIINVLGESAVRSLALALAVAVMLRVLRVQHARLAKRAWTVVLILALAMPALVALHIPSFSFIALWSTPRTVIVPAASASVQNSTLLNTPFAVSPPQQATPQTPEIAPAVTLPVPIPAALQGAPAPHRSIAWWKYGFAAYLAITSLLLFRVLLGLALAARLWRRAQAFATSETALPVRLSVDIHSPATVGRGILLPLEAIEWDSATLRATLAHEEKHIREGDFYLQLAATLHHCFFWISPHAWWLRPQLARLSETICDRAAIAASGDGLSYAQLLLRFAAAEQAPAGMVAMAQSAGLRERIDRLIADPDLTGAFRRRRGQALLASLLLIAAALITAATLHIVQPQAVVLAAPQAPPPPADTTPVAVIAPVPQAANAPASSAIVMPSPAAKPQPPSSDLSFAPVMALAPFPVRPIFEPGLRMEAAPAIRALTVSPHVVVQPLATLPRIIANADVRADVLAIPPQVEVISPNAPPDGPTDRPVRGYAIYGGQSSYSRILGRGWPDVSKNFNVEAKKHAQGAILFTRDGKTWVIDDLALVKQAQEAYAPVGKLGKQQGELGTKQGELGAKQGELGAREGEIGAKQGEWGAMQGKFAEDFHFEMPKDFDKALNQLVESETKFAAEQETLSESQRASLEAQKKAAQANFDKVMAEFKAQEPQREAWAKQMQEQGEQMRKNMEPMLKQMREMAAKQGELGRQQSELGRQQALLGQQQRDATRQADEQIWSLIDQAIKNGKAHPVE